MNYLQELPSQAFFESLIRKPMPEETRYAPLVIVYFSARWCGGCRRVDLPTHMGVRPDAVWYSCDVDDNTYTPSYCGIRTIPAFQAIVNGVPLPLVTTSDNAAIRKWLDELPSGR
jgi:thioredoxin-like negative regulator of GroEL